MMIDLKDFYLKKPMERQEFPQDVIDHYDLKSKLDGEGLLLVLVEKGMYGLPQAGIIA